MGSQKCKITSRGIDSVNSTAGAEFGVGSEVRTCPRSDSLGHRHWWWERDFDASKQWLNNTYGALIFNICYYIVIMVKCLIVWTFHSSPKMTTLLSASCEQTCVLWMGGWIAVQFCANLGTNKPFHVFYPTNIAPIRIYDQSYHLMQELLCFSPHTVGLNTLSFYLSDMFHQIKTCRSVDGFRSRHIKPMYLVTLKKAMVSMNIYQDTAKKFCFSLLTKPTFI